MVNFNVCHDSWKTAHLVLEYTLSNNREPCFQCLKMGADRRCFQSKRLNISMFFSCRCCLEIEKLIFILFRERRVNKFERLLCWCFTTIQWSYRKMKFLNINLQESPSVRNWKRIHDRAHQQKLNETITKVSAHMPFSTWGKNSNSLPNPYGTNAKNIFQAASDYNIFRKQYTYDAPKGVAQIYDIPL